MPEDIGDLSRRERFDRSVCLLYSVYQIGSEGMPERVQTFLFYPRRREYPVVPFAEVGRARVVAVLVRYIVFPIAFSGT